MKNTVEEYSEDQNVCDEKDTPKQSLKSLQEQGQSLDGLGIFDCGE